MVPQLAESGSIHSLNHMTAHQNFAFQQLLSAWRVSDDARLGGDLAERAHTCLALDVARTDMQASLRGLR
jgi:hypothetical protein